jgi:hypothetical protein
MYPNHDHTHGWHGRTLANQTAARSRRSPTASTAATTAGTTAAAAVKSVAALATATASTGIEIFQLCLCMNLQTRAGKSYWRGRLSTIDPHLLTSLDQLLFMLKILIYLFTKQPALMRRSTVQLVFPDQGHRNRPVSMFVER